MEKEKQPTNDREGLVNVLQRARQVVLCAHVSPDGDTIGSCLALRLALQRLGKEATVICQDKVPNMLSFLPGADSILRPEKLNVAHPELALCVDVSDQRRLGSCIRVVEAAGRRRRSTITVRIPITRRRTWWRRTPARRACWCGS